MSLIITKNFKRAKAQDAAARNAASDELNVGDKIWITQYGRNYPYTITKKWKEGWTVWYKAKNDKSGKEEIVSGAFANALDAAAKDSFAADAKFKERDDVFVKMPDGHEEEGTIVRVYTDHYDVKLWDSGVRAVGFSKVRAMTAADAGDAAARDMKFKKGDIVKINPSSLLMKLYGPKRLEWRGRVVGYGVSYEHPVIEWESPCTLGREPIHEMHIVKA